jgi:hypothetical protein
MIIFYKNLSNNYKTQSHGVLNILSNLLVHYPHSPHNHQPLISLFDQTL